MSNKESNLVLENSLQSFFFEKLKNINEKSATPLPKESLFYSSLVMDKFGESQNFFDTSDSGVKEKILGMQYLESMSLPLEKKKRVLKEIGDTSLFLCGFFSESVNRKIVDIRYYQDIGKSAYQSLNSLVPEFYDIEGFYRSFSHSFFDVVSLMALVSKQFQSEFDEYSLLLVRGKTKAA